LAELLKQPISFAGEGRSDHLTHTQVSHVQGILSTQRVLKLTGTLAGELRDAVMFIRTQSQPTLTLSTVAHEAVRRELARLAQIHNEGQPFPHYERPTQLDLFPAAERSIPEQAGNISARDHTHIQKSST
jgi:hypothetical protein